MSTPENSVAFIGLGVMGYHMAVNLRSKMASDKTLLIADVSEKALDRFQQQMQDRGAVRVVQNGYEAAQQANTIITMLPKDEAMKVVYLDPTTGIIAGAEAASKASKEQKLIIECGTIGQATIYEVRDAAKEVNGLTFLDAPVSGGPMGSEAGTLTFMVGCPADMFPQLRSLLSHMGTAINRCGEVGSGTSFKTINNYISIISVLTACEALNIGAKMGLDMRLLVDTINASSGQSWVMSKNNPVPGIHPNAPASHDYQGGFRIELAQKDLRLGTQLAEMVGAKNILAKSTLDALDEVAADSRYEGKDLRVVYKWLNEM